MIVLWLLLLTWINGSSSHLTVINTNETYVFRSAAFGARIKEYGFNGTLLPISSLDLNHDSHGCSILKNVSIPNDWIALVERGECNFVEKVRNMQRSGAIAVVVGDNQPGTTLLTMFAASDASDVIIPSVFIAQWEYRDLRSQSMEKGILINMMPSQPPLPVLGMLFLVVMMPMLVIALVFIGHRIRRVRMERSLVADEISVDSLPTRRWKFEGEEEVCAICLEEFQDGDMVRILACHHEFHPDCIDPWLTERKRTCPCCKQDALESGESTPLLPRRMSRSRRVITYWVGRLWSRRRRDSQVSRSSIGDRIEDVVEGGEGGLGAEGGADLASENQSSIVEGFIESLQQDQQQDNPVGSTENV